MNKQTMQNLDGNKINLRINTLPHISITGDLGSGKSSVAKYLTKKLGIPYLSTGLLQREIARQKGMNTLELNQYSENNREVDDFLDNKLIEMNTIVEPHVIDSRLAWHFVKKSLKIYLSALPEVAAKRVLDDKIRKDEPLASNIEEKSKDLQLRRKLENERFSHLYKIECDDLENYDLIIDSSFATIEQIGGLILSILEIKQEKLFFNKFWIAPKSIFPTEHVRNLSDIKIAKERKLAFHEVIPIEIVLFNGDFFVWDGHKRLSRSIKYNSPFIPATLLATNEEEINEGLVVSSFVESSFNMSWLYDWEDVHGFRFVHYPKLDG